MAAHVVKRLNDVEKAERTAVMREIDEALIRQAHKGLEAMSKVTGALRENDFVEAEQALAAAQQIITALMKQVGDKARAALQTPDPDTGDRG